MGRLRPKEIERGVCLVGPHRDDLVLTLGDLPAKGYASHGESWSFALALRLASYALLSGDAPAGDAWVADWGPDGEPVLILDDVFAELDARRRDRLAELVARLRAGADHGRGGGRRARAARRCAGGRHGRGGHPCPLTCRETTRCSRPRRLLFRTACRCPGSSS